MSATFQRVLLSGSTSGRPVKVVATATPGTTLHTATALAGAIDEVYLYVTNTSGAAVALTMEWGGVTTPDDLIMDAVSIPADSGPILIIPGLPMSAGLLIKAFASSANVLLVTGWGNRITP
jgi:hypothetical protein